MVTELCIMQFWSKILIVISNLIKYRAAQYWINKIFVQTLKNCILSDLKIDVIKW